MTVLRFEGVLRKTGYNPALYLIGDRNVLEEVWDMAPAGSDHVIVELGEATAIDVFHVGGELEIEQGMDGYSEWTPGTNPRFYVGREDLLEKLEKLEGKTVVLTVAIPDKS